MRTLINKFFTWLGSIGLDKYQHFTFGVLVACISALTVCWLPLWAIVIISMLCTALVALGKEWYDDIVDWWDFGFTMFGGLTVWIALVL
jgi:hypothetical protein